MSGGTLKEEYKYNRIYTAGTRAERNEKFSIEFCAFMSLATRQFYCEKISVQISH